MPVLAVSDRLVEATISFEYTLVRYVSRTVSGVAVGAIWLALVTPWLQDSVPPVVIKIVSVVETISVVEIVSVVETISVIEIVSIVETISVIETISVVEIVSVVKAILLLLGWAHRLANCSQNSQCGTIAAEELSVSYAGHQHNTTQQDRRSNNHYSLSKKLSVGIRATTKTS